MKRIPRVWLYTAVLLLAAVLRLAWLAHIPPGLAQDEVLDADIVDVILRGEHALFFWQGYGHEPLQHYFSVPFRWAVGDNWLAIRLPSVVMGLLVVALTLRWARREFGPPTAVIAATYLALNWWPIIFSRIGIRPISEPVFLLLGALFWHKRPWLGGLFWGLSLYTYTGARVVLAVPLLVAAAQWAARPRTKPYPIWPFFLTACATALPLFLTLALNPDLQQRLDQLAGPLDALRAGDVRPVLGTIGATLGAFSFTADPRWTYGHPLAPLFDPLTAVLFHAGLLIALWRWREPRHTLLLVWLAITLLPSALSPDAPSTVRMVGALPVVFIFPALALRELWQMGRRGGGAEEQRGMTSDLRLNNPISYSLILSLALALTFGRTAYWGFGQWAQAAETHDKYQTIWRDVATYWRDTAAPAPPVIASAYFVPLDALTVRRTINNDPHGRWVQTGAGLAGALVIPADLAPTSQLFIPEFAPPAPALLTAAHLPLQPPFRSATTPSFATYPLAGATIAPHTPQNSAFGGVITLLGYDVLTTVGEPLQLITYWRVDAAVPPDLKAFTHLLNPQGEIIAQHDGWDAVPATLRVGDVVIQRHVLDTTTADPTWPLAIRLGLYQFQTGQRLPTTGGEFVVISE